MTKVFAWPPVGVVAHEWTEESPVSASASLLTGKAYVSASQRPRRMASLTISALSKSRSGAGYSEVLKRLLAGGEHLVRLYSTPINRCQDALPGAVLRSMPLDWLAGGIDLTWVSGAAPLLWSDVPALTGTIGTDAAGFDILTVTDLPPLQLIARPGEFVTVFATLEAVAGTTIMVMTEAWANASGIAVLRLMSPAPYAARVNIGTRDTAVFRALDYPRAAQPIGQNWFYPWNFREVFEDEVPGGFVEVNPWS